MRKFLIFSPPYNEKQGGVICLHKLAHLINESGNEAYLFPAFENLEFNRKNLLIPTLKFCRDLYRMAFQNFKTNKHLNTPIFKGRISDLKSDEWIVVYYEQVFGNPLNARNVVRWLLHQPGFHTGQVYYGFNELHVRFNEATRPFLYPNSMQANFFLPIIHYPLELYNKNGTAEQRTGTAYCLRKGKGKPIQHDLNDSILIDRLSHERVSKIFKRVKTFVSYDSYTAYSRLASLCGAESIVIPDEGVSEEQWYPNPEDRLGVAYGFENIERAQKTSALLLAKIEKEQNESAHSVGVFIDACEEFFERERYNIFRKKHAR